MEIDNMEIDVPKYDEKGFWFKWEDGFVFRSFVDEYGEVCIEANKAGLISLARHLLEMAQDGKLAEISEKWFGKNISIVGAAE